MKCENWNEDLTDAESVNKDYRDHNVHYRKASEIVSSLHKKLVSKQVLIPVSYTHLTLPTILLV